MEKMKLQGGDRKVMASAGTLPAWRFPGHTLASWEESRLRLREMGKGKRGRREGEGGTGKDRTITGGSGDKGQDICYLAARHLPGGDTDSMDEARCKKSQQEAKEN